MKTKVLLFLLLCTNWIGAQDTVSGTLVDANTGAPIPYVNIGIKELSRGTVSDDKGVFQLKVDGPDDKITFSSIGYEEVEIKARALKDAPKIPLSPKEYKVQEVEIQATRFNGDEKMFGVRNKDRGTAVGFGNPQLGTEIGALIEIDQPTYIKSANFVLNHAKGDSLLFRVNIYDYRNKQIGEKMIGQDVFIKEKQRKGTITIDLTPYGLVLDNDVLLALEWIRNYDELGSKGVTFDTKKAKQLKGIYLKTTSHSPFKVLPFNKKKKPCFYFIGKQSR